ncbi:MAG TPA: PIN domain-containing protein [Solirubrobacterales bacterium]|nr:PIN domain-containing protein [Solirubrobacterales bacterium]
MLLLDASVWAAVVDPKDRFHSSAKSIVGKLDHDLGALDLTLYEIANVVGVKMGLPEQARDMAQLVVDRCQDRLLALNVALLHAACVSAGVNDLTAYDAAYVAAADRTGWTLVSADIADLVSKGLAVTPDAAVYP